VNVNYNPFSLENKTILVTGASGGIGRSACVECSRLGARIILCARNEIRLNETLVLMEKNDHKIISADLRDDSGIQKVLDGTEKIDGAVFNAGISRPLPVNFITRKKMQEIFPLNLESPILLFSALLKQKKMIRGSSAVFTASINGTAGGEKAESLYSATKGGLSGFVKSCSLDLAPKGIRVNCVCPGMTRTQILSDGTITAEQLELNAKNYPMGRHGSPEEIAWGIIYLLSDASSFVTGTNLTIDGGISQKI
jgi:NAD(P)-dependent dehydrogenase (short-subunit alcohol dehydrogenase family)